MDLWVTALALADGHSQAVILDIDIQILVNELADSLRKHVSTSTGLPVEFIRASASHTHSGPTPYKSWITQGYELVEPWLAALRQKCAEAAGEAVKGLQPVRVRAGRGECFINTNRRAVGTDGKIILGKNPDGFSDREVLVLSFETSDATKIPNETIATVVNYACHPTVMGHSNRLITPDYPGATRRTVEAAIGGKCLFLLGAAGNQGPVQGFQADTAVYRHLGETLGHEAAKIALSTRLVPTATRLREEIQSGGTLGMYEDAFAELRSTPLRVLEREIAVPLRDDIPSEPVARETAAAAHAELTAAREANDETKIAQLIVKARRADLKLRLAQDFQGRSDVAIRTHFICFGDIALVACNIEPFAETGVNIKRNSPFPFTLVSGYTNGRLAYMATANEWPRGGHEVINSPFGRNAADVFEQRVVEILKEVREGTVNVAA